MRHLQGPVSAVAFAALVAGGCGARTSDVLGRSVTLVPREGGAPKEKGELLAVDQGRIWVRTRDGVRDFDPAEALRRLAPAYKTQEGRLEQAFWASRFRK